MGIMSPKFIKFELGYIKLCQREAHLFHSLIILLSSSWHSFNGWPCALYYRLWSYN